MSIEGGPQVNRDSWRLSAEGASEVLYPRLLEQLKMLQPEGDRAVIKGILRVEGIQTVSDGEIAQLWLLSQFDERAHEEISRMVQEGRCTSEDIAAVFFKMAELGLF